MIYIITYVINIFPLATLHCVFDLIRHLWQVNAISYMYLVTMLYLRIQWDLVLYSRICIYAWILDITDNLHMIQ